MIKICCPEMLEAVDKDRVITVLEGGLNGEDDGIFILSFNQNGGYDRINYCPFCGEDIRKVTV